MYNKSMIHVDFSYNQFNAFDIDYIGKIKVIINKFIGIALKSNQTILGIHILGNEGKIDEQGFVTPEKN